MSRILIGIRIQTYNNDFHSPSRRDSDSFHVYLASRSSLTALCWTFSRCTCLQPTPPGSVLETLLVSWDLFEWDSLLLSLSVSGYTIWPTAAFCIPCVNWVLHLLMLRITQKSLGLLCIPPWLHSFCFVWSFDANKSLLKCLSVFRKRLRRSWVSCVSVCLSVLVNAVLRW